MKSKTSFCNSALLKKNISRFAVIWGLYLGALVLGSTLVLLNLGNLFLSNGGPELKEVFHGFLSVYAIFGGNYMNGLYGIICAVACFSYLHKTRSAYMMHAFPMSRGTLFNTNLISGLLFGLAPQLIVTVMNLGVAAIDGTRLYADVLMTFGVQALEFLFFYGLGVFCMVMTGKSIFGILSYAVLNYIVVLLELVLRVILTPLMFGVKTLEHIVTLPLSPSIWLTKAGVDNLERIDNHFARPECWRYLAVIAAVGIVLMLVSRLLYDKRHMENAGEVVAFRWARPIFKYFFTVCVSLFLGLLITTIAATRELADGASAGMIICLLVAGFIGYFAAEMMLNRTVKVFKGKAFLGFAIYAAILLALLLTVKFDVFGIVRRVPEPETVSKVEIKPYYRDEGTVTFTDPDDIETLTKMHQKLLDTQKLPEINSYGYQIPEEYGEWVSVEVTYHLNNGTSFSREYRDVYSGLASEDFSALMDGKPELLESYYDSAKFSMSTNIWISNYPESFDSYRHMTDSEMKHLRECLQQDIDAGTILLYEDILQCSYETCFEIRVGDCYIIVPESAKNAYGYLKLLDTIYR